MEFDATEIANLIKTKQLSPKEAVMTAFSEIKTKNGQLNAVVSLREEKALEEAKRCVDLARPFAGVPILLKSLGQYLEGEPATDGSKLFKDAKATQTDNFVKALQQAGFIIIGQSNAPEFGFTNVTDSKLYGPARNPWNPELGRVFRRGCFSSGFKNGAACCSKRRRRLNQNSGIVYRLDRTETDARQNSGRPFFMARMAGSIRLVCHNAFDQRHSQPACRRSNGSTTGSVSDPAAFLQS